MLKEIMVFFTSWFKVRPGVFPWYYRNIGLKTKNRHTQVKSYDGKDGDVWEDPDQATYLWAYLSLYPGDKSMGLSAHCYIVSCYTGNLG